MSSFSKRKLEWDYWLESVKLAKRMHIGSRGNRILRMLFVQSHWQSRNILLKGRFGPSFSSAPAGVDMCDAVIYRILANDDPKEYPLGGPMSKPISAYSSEDGACTIIEYGYSQTVQNCDCSDPKNYNFYDEGRFKIWKVK